MNRLKIEVLYPEVANLYGDLFNAYLLQRSYPDSIEVIETHLKDEPTFPKAGIDFIFMGASPEKYQEMAIDLLSPYTKELKSFMESGKPALFTGNALEILGEYIEDEGKKIPCLGLHEGHAVRKMMARYNSMYLGEVDFSNCGSSHGEDTKKENTKEEPPLKIVGFKSQFSKTFGLDSSHHLIHTLRERDKENSSVDEGLKLNNIMGTYLTGPFLIMNPLFAKHILSLMGISDPKLIHEEELIYSYSKRLEEALDPNTDFTV